MSQEIREYVHALKAELNQLRRQVRVTPSHQALSRIAELEGILAAYAEEAAWNEARRALRRLGMQC